MKKVLKKEVEGRKKSSDLGSQHKGRCVIN
jgi:hypothetical protein